MTSTGAYNIIHDVEGLDSDRAVKKLVIGLGFMSVISASDV